MVNVKTLKFILILCIVIEIIFLSIFVKDQIKYSAYHTVQATIVKTETNYGSASNSRSKTHLVTYEYDIDGKKYSATKQVFTTTGKKIGDIETIRYNPNALTEIENTLLSGVYLAIILFLVVFIVSLCLIIQRRKRRK